MASIHNAMLNFPNDVFMTEAYRRLLEEHLLYLRGHEDTSLFEISPALAFKYDGNLYGLLAELNVEPRWFWTIMRLNRLERPSHYRGGELSKPPIAVIEGLVKLLLLNTALQTI